MTRRPLFLRIAAALLALQALHMPAARAQAPSWWYTRAVLDTNAQPSDYALVNQGQLKWIATNAMDELQAKLPGGSGTNLMALVASFSSTNNHLSANCGEVKALAAAYYDRLIQVGFATNYPWAGSTSVSDYAVCNVGQVKNLFSFDVKPIYTDAGFMSGCTSRTWSIGASSTNFVSPTLHDGGFESSHATGGPPDSGYWQIANVGQAGVVCTTTSAHSGNNGLWSYTGSAAGDYFSATYQAYNTYAGDRWVLSAYVRQVSTWVNGASAFVRLKFFFEGIAVSTSDSPTQVTSAGQGWTYCSVTSTVPPAATNVQMELVVLKPQVAGQAIANFDDCTLVRQNSFDSRWLDTSAPEGLYDFRSSVVAGGGWGVVLQNGVTNLTQYGGGNLVFWLKSPSTTKVEIQSVTGTTTNTSLVAQFSPTTNGGQTAWQQKSITLSTVTNLNLTNVASPFLFTDLGSNSASFVDGVYWVKIPH